MSNIAPDQEQIESKNMAARRAKDIFDWSDYAEQNVEEIIELVCSGFTRYGYPASPLIISLISNICEINDDIINGRDCLCIKEKRLEIEGDLDALVDAYRRHMRN